MIVLIILIVIGLIALFIRFKAESAHRLEIDIYTRAELDRMNKTEKNES